MATGIHLGHTPEKLARLRFVSFRVNVDLVFSHFPILDHTNQDRFKLRLDFRQL
jgi:hypothetical protein